MINPLDKSTAENLNFVSWTFAAWVFDIAVWGVIISLYWYLFIMPFFHATMITLPVAISLRIVIGGLVNRTIVRREIVPDKAIANSFLTSVCDLVFSGGLAAFFYLLEKL